MINQGDRSDDGPIELQSRCLTGGKSLFQKGSVRAEDLPRSGRRNLLQGQSSRTVGEGLQKNRRTNWHVRRGSRCRQRRDRFFLLLHLVQALYSQTNQKAAQWS